MEASDQTPAPPAPSEPSTDPNVQTAPGPPNPNAPTGTTAEGDAPPEGPVEEAAAEGELTDAQKADLDRLDQLHSDGVLSDEQYDQAKANIESGGSRYDPTAPPHAWGNVPGINTPPGPTEEQIAASAGVQSPGEPQEVAEQRPQAFQGTPGAGVSESSKRLDVSQPHGPEEIAAANSEANKAAADENSRMPNLVVGTRVQIVEPHSEAGRMAFVQSIVYKDGIQQMLAAADTPERRFAEVLQYILVTRDGRSDTLTAEPNEVKALDVIQGWGRGQI